MPELPEVETTRRGIAAALGGRRVEKLLIRERRLRWPVPQGIEAALEGCRVHAVERRAKYLLLRFDTGTAIVHLGMSGSLRVLVHDPPPRRHDHWDLVLDDGVRIRYHDPRRFGSLLFTTEDPAGHPLIAPLGPEPLGDAFDAAILFRATRRREVAIKVLLMNARIVVGVGNIYANEALFRAGVHPALAARRLTRTQAAALVEAVKTVLAEAIRIGGTTLRDYVDAAGELGSFRQELAVYERAGEPCRRCRTPIRRRVLGQRATYWCPCCQRR
ncbi:MAG: bifunctional DNA-formamidopyrimidine glycosylase/DNA-(apurinic or apyrimidinic site) lyase [Gammaproteobacteria bacterium]|nr:bifunctional DNA-formamidopyrimidine glycosylase/DNA-(apurinic or apyrimidinic site) lyase [Gammaproteobacteria bacterium]